MICASVRQTLFYKGSKFQISGVTQTNHTTEIYVTSTEYDPERQDQVYDDDSCNFLAGFSVSG